MSTVESNVADSHGNGDGAHAHHDPNLAHHFETPEQQYQSAKLGMWIFLGTEILMFGGLFCAYSVYRHNHPDVFEYAHQALNRWLGAVNTVVLITSSLTMAWGVRASQLGQQKALRWLLGVTIIGGFGFLGIKAIEYHTKWEHQLFAGKENVFFGWDGVKQLPHVHIGEEGEAEPAAGHEVKSEGAAGGEKHTPAENAPEKSPVSVAAVAPAKAPDAAVEPAKAAPMPAVLPPGGARDPNTGLPDEAKIAANWADPKGLSEKIGAKDVAEHFTLADVKSVNGKKTIYTFFAIYFFMTGLHGLHVVIGMSLIYWVLLRSVGPKGRAWLVPAAPLSIGLFVAYLGIVIGIKSEANLVSMAGNYCMIFGIGLAVISAIWAAIRSMRVRNDNKGEFGPDYYTPVDLVGLYWHLVDLIWIFLFPLLYLIH